MKENNWFKLLTKIQDYTRIDDIFLYSERLVRDFTYGNSIFKNSIWELLFLKKHEKEVFYILNIGFNTPIKKTRIPSRMQASRFFKTKDWIALNCFCLQSCRRARPGFEPGTPCTISKNHTTRPTSRAMCIWIIINQTLAVTFSPLLFL